MVEIVHDLIILRKNQHVIVIVPACDVLLLSVVLPKLNRQRLMQALPFALEEKLISDVSQLHFAVGAYQACGSLPVAVVDKTKMNQWLDLLRTAAIFPDILIPMTLALPYTEHRWTLYKNGSDCIVRTGLTSGFVCEAENLNLLLNTNEIPIDEIASQNDLLEMLSNRNDENDAINLLQAPYQPQYKSISTKKTWLLKGAFALACVFLLMMGHVVSWVLLQNATSKTDQAINKIYQYHFPNASAIVAPRERMTDKLKKMSSPMSQDGLLYLLAYVSDAFKKASDINVEQIDYHNHLLLLNLSTSALSSLDIFVQALKKSGLSVKQQSTASADQRVRAELQISQGGR